MKDVATILRDLAGGEVELKRVMDTLQAGPSAERSKTWARFLVRIRRAAGLPPLVGVPATRGAILELLDTQEPDNDESEPDEEETPDHR